VSRSGPPFAAASGPPDRASGKLRLVARTTAFAEPFAAHFCREMAMPVAIRSPPASR
jgi:hypothetical protein